MLVAYFRDEKWGNVSNVRRLEVWKRDAKEQVTCGIIWLNWFGKLRYLLETNSRFTHFALPAHCTLKRCHLHQRRKNPKSDKFSSLPLAYPEYLQLGVSEAAPGTTFHQRQANCHFHVASWGLHEPIREGLWKGGMEWGIST